MRGLIGLVVVLVLVAGTAQMAGCSGATGQGVPSAGEAVPEAPRVLRVAAPRPALPVYDSGAGSSAATFQYLTPVFDGLTWVDDRGQIQPALATSWSSADGQSWEFRLREDIVFHNGERFDAESVRASFARYLDPEERLAIASTFGRVALVDVIDASTVVIRLRGPDPTLPRLVAFALMLPPRALAREGAQQFFAAPAGSGPFTITAPDLARGLTFDAARSGFVSPRGRPGLDSVQYVWIGENATREAALASGEVDVANGLVPDGARRLEASGSRVVARTGLTTVHFLLRQDSGPLADVRVRRAVNFAVNKESTVNNLLRGYARIDQGQLLGAEVLGYNPDLNSYPYNPAQARILLSQAGFPQGFSATLAGLQNPLGGSDIAEAVAANLRAVGIQTETQILEPAVWVRAYYGSADQRGDFFLSFLNWEQTFEAGSVYRFFSSDQPEPARRWENKRFDALYQEARATLDERRRGDLYRQAARVLRDDAAALFLWQPSTLAAMRPGVDFDPALFPDRILRFRVN